MQLAKPLEDVAISNIQQSKREEWLEKMAFRVEQALSRFGNSALEKSEGHYSETIFRRRRCMRLYGV